MRPMKTLMPPQQGLSSLLRPRFEAGLLLEDDDLTAGIEYTRSMMRLMFRSLFGCGVICGLSVEGVLTCNEGRVTITIGKGLALDCRGDPIEIQKAQTLMYDPDCQPLPPKIWVTVCYIEKCCGPRDISCSPDDDGHVSYTRARQGFEIRLYDQPPECACYCKAPPKPNGAPAGGCCEEDATAKASAAEDGGHADSDTICACYEDHNKGICDCDCGCDCVVIGVIDTTKKKKDADPKAPALQVDASMVRKIRPVLTGYFFDCFKRGAKAYNGGTTEESAEEKEVQPIN